MRKPTREEIQQATDKTLQDIIAPNLKILFCGINPGLYSAAVGHHFARPGNRFWPALYRAGLTPRQLSPEEDATLLDYGYGLTDVVERASTAAAELSVAEMIAGREALVAKVLRYRPHILAVLGISVYRVAFQQPKAALGRQSNGIGETEVWALPNPSGLNAHYRIDCFIEWLQTVKEASEQSY